MRQVRERVALGRAALELGYAIGYQSAGTVEFLVDDETGDFYFLEVNTRLQVEHPVTEEVTGIDLVREQLRIAAGEELGYDQDDVEFDGWAIEARLCAEDPGAGFLPATGTLVAFDPAGEPWVRWESGVERGSVVSVLALERLHLGGVATNRDFLAATLRHEGFLAGDTTTSFIERYEPARTLELSRDELTWATTAGALWLQGANRATTPVLQHVPSGWRNARLPRQRVSFRWNDEPVEVIYRSRRDGSFSVGDEGSARVLRWSEYDIDAEVNGRRATARVTRTGDVLFVQASRGTARFEIVPRFAVPGVEAAHGGLNAPMPGLIIDVRVSEGQHVQAGDTLVVMEAMKMEHVITAPSTGVVTQVLVTSAQQVEGGAALLTIEDDADKDGD